MVKTRSLVQNMTRKSELEDFGFLQVILDLMEKYKDEDYIPMAGCKALLIIIRGQLAKLSSAQKE